MAVSMGSDYHMVAIMSYAFGMSQTMSAMIPITARMVQIMDFTSWVV